MTANIRYNNLSKTLFTGTIFFIILLLVACDRRKEGDSQRVEDSFFSKSMNEERALTLYFPPGFDAKEKYDLIYATDGQLIDKDYQRELDQLIQKGEMAPLVIIGVHSNEREVAGSDWEYRNFEYTKNQSSDAVLSKLYDKHQLFFTDEVEQYIQQKYGLLAARKIFYGTSNGAGFGFNLLCVSQDKFDAYLLYSIAGADFGLIDTIQQPTADVYISHGDKEPLPLVENITKKVLKLQEKNQPVFFNVFEGGHSRVLWKKQFFADLKSMHEKSQLSEPSEN